MRVTLNEHDRLVVQAENLDEVNDLTRFTNLGDRANLRLEIFSLARGGDGDVDMISINWRRTTFWWDLLVGLRIVAPEPEPEGLEKILRDAQNRLKRGETRP